MQSYKDSFINKKIDKDKDNKWCIPSWNTHIHISTHFSIHVFIFVCQTDSCREAFFPSGS